MPLCFPLRFPHRQHLCRWRLRSGTLLGLPPLAVRFNAFTSTNFLFILPIGFGTSHSLCSAFLHHLPKYYWICYFQSFHMYMIRPMSCLYLSIYQAFLLSLPPIWLFCSRSLQAVTSAHQVFFTSLTFSFFKASIPFLTGYFVLKDLDPLHQFFNLNLILVISVATSLFFIVTIFHYYFATITSFPWLVSCTHTLGTIFLLLQLWLDWNKPLVHIRSGPFLLFICHFSSFFPLT